MGKKRRGATSESFVEGLRASRQDRQEGKSGQEGQSEQEGGDRQEGQSRREGQIEQEGQNQREWQSRQDFEGPVYSWSAPHQQALQKAIDEKRIPPLPTRPLPKPWRETDIPKWTPSDWGMRGEYSYELNAQGQPKWILPHQDQDGICHTS